MEYLDCVLVTLTLKNKQFDSPNKWRCTIQDEQRLTTSKRVAYHVLKRDYDCIHSTYKIEELESIEIKFNDYDKK